MRVWLSLPSSLGESTANHEEMEHWKKKTRGEINKSFSDAQHGSTNAFGRLPNMALSTTTDHGTASAAKR